MSDGDVTLHGENYYSSDWKIENGKLVAVNKELTGCLKIPYGVTTIGENAFKGVQCTEVVIPDSVETIEADAFYCCFTIERIKISNSVKIIGEGAFCGCKFFFVEIPGSVKSIGRMAFALCKNLMTVKINEGVESIGARVFCECPISRLDIPASVTFIDDEAFFDFYSLEQVFVSPDNKTYKSVDGDLYSYDGTKLIKCFAGRKRYVHSFKIPNGVVTVGRCAFDCLDKLYGVTIPESVTTIEAYAFGGCQIRDIEIPAVVDFIGEDAFFRCDALKSVVFKNPRNWTLICSSEDHGNTVEKIKKISPRLLKKPQKAADLFLNYKGEKKGCEPMRRTI